MVTQDISNKNLTNLDNISYQNDIKILILSYNYLVNINNSDIPEDLLGLYIDENQTLTTLDISSKLVMDTLSASYCALTSNNIIVSNTLYFLNLSNNDLDNLQFLTNCTQLTYLDVSYNDITSLNYCPNVTTLIINNNKLTNLNYLPITVVKLDISNNLINDINDLTESHSINEINISDTNITSLLNLPTSCKSVINTSSQTISNIPDNIYIKRNSNKRGKNNKTIVFPIPENGKTITNKLTLIANCIYPGNNINISRISFEINVSSGTVDIKVIFISKKKNITHTLLSDTITSDDTIYDYPINFIPSQLGKIEIHAKKNTTNATCIFKSCILY